VSFPSREGTGKGVAIFDFIFWHPSLDFDCVRSEEISVRIGGHSIFSRARAFDGCA